MRQTITLGLITLVAMSFAEVANADLFAAMVTGQLQAVHDDSYDLEGATITIVYSADTTDTATKTGFAQGVAYSYFDVFTMDVMITDRPNFAPDITGLSTSNDPIVHNHFPPSSDNDDLTFDSRNFDVPRFIGLGVGPLQLDFESQTFFPGTDLVTDLSFFGPLIGSNVLPGQFTADITAGFGINADDYELTGIEISIVPGPPTCPWDLDGTGSVGLSDLLSLLADWGPCKGCPADFDDDGDVGVSDLLALLANWGPCP